MLLNFLDAVKDCLHQRILNQYTIFLCWKMWSLVEIQMDSDSQVCIHLEMFQRSYYQFMIPGSNWVCVSYQFSSFHLIDKVLTYPLILALSLLLLLLKALLLLIIFQLKVWQHQVKYLLLLPVEDLPPALHLYHLHGDLI